MDDQEKTDILREMYAPPDRLELAESSAEEFVRTLHIENLRELLNGDEASLSLSDFRVDEESEELRISSVTKISGSLDLEQEGDVEDLWVFRGRYTATLTLDDDCFEVAASSRYEIYLELAMEVEVTGYEVQEVRVVELAMIDPKGEITSEADSCTSS